MSKIIITSKNPVKAEAVKIAISKMFPDQNFEFESVSVPSGVSDQPLTDNETYTGALNRVLNAEKVVEADYYIGLEGGVEFKNDGLEAFAWMVVKSGGRVGKARSATFFLPHKVGELIRQGMELGDADDIVFRKQNSKQSNGAVGLLTGDVITRTSYYVETLCMALIPFKNPDLY